MVDGNQVEKVDQKTDAITRPMAMPNTGSVSGKSVSSNRQLEWVNNGGLDDVTHGQTDQEDTSRVEFGVLTEETYEYETIDDK